MNLKTVYLKYLKGFKSSAQSIYKKLYVFKQNEITCLLQFQFNFLNKKQATINKLASYL